MRSEDCASAAWKCCPTAPSQVAYSAQTGASANRQAATVCRRCRRWRPTPSTRRSAIADAVVAGSAARQASDSPIDRPCDASASRASAASPIGTGPRPATGIASPAGRRQVGTAGGGRTHRVTMPRPRPRPAGAARRCHVAAGSGRPNPPWSCRRPRPGRRSRPALRPAVGHRCRLTARSRWPRSRCGADGAPRSRWRRAAPWRRCIPAPPSSE